MEVGDKIIFDKREGFVESVIVALEDKWVIVKSVKTDIEGVFSIDEMQNLIDSGELILTKGYSMKRHHL